MILKSWSALLIVPSLAWSQEPSSFERQMHNIYKSSYSQEVSDDLWNGYVNNINRRSYTVSPGDTLWGLSQVFFGEGAYWSKIWSYNQKLTNPHLVKIGETIHFFTGSVDEPPSLSISDSANPTPPEPPVTNVPKNFVPVEEAETATVAVTDSADAPPQPLPSPQKPVGNLYPGAPSIPPPMSDITPVLEVLPSTFRNAETFDSSKYDDKGISLDLRPPVRVNPLFVAHSFLYGSEAEKYPRVGDIIESEDGNLLVGLNQEVYIESKENLKPGDLFTVMGRDYEFDRNGISGSVIRFLAKLKITDKLPNNRYRGETLQSLSGIRGGSWITRENIPYFADDYVGRPSNLRLQVIGGGADNVSRIFGESDVVYLKGGANQGVRVGDILGVYKTRALRVEEPKIAVSPTPIAHIKVVRAEPNLASGFVINSNEVILPGDETGSPTIVSDSQVMQSEKDDLNSLEGGLEFENPTQKAEGESLEEELQDLE